MLLTLAPHIHVRLPLLSVPSLGPPTEQGSAAAIVWNQCSILKHHLNHGGRLSSGSKASSIGVLEVKCKGGLGAAGGDVDQIVVLLIC